MDKETYIYNHLKDFIEDTETQNDTLEKITEWVYIEFQVNIYFCEIKGKRWSFIAGRQNVLSAPNRIKVNDHIGIIAEDNDIQDDTWNTLTSAINRILQQGENPSH